MNKTYLNLARKWRSKNFDQIIGQDLSVRMIKNTLYLNHFFPVYLFAGQRGCGKTSTARVFAAAINCEMLSEFQKDPRKTVLPCFACASCKAMEEGNHPDFIEMDAASHTGVDNVRQIIEAASLLPLLGRKKVYLIDEAHMLSKAAFNAFLKILEEPPASVLFILATTDDKKIIETVRSRCFQLFFRAIAPQDLYKLLVSVCEKEEIGYDDAGLQLLIRETEGSARDALNLLEQVRFSSDKVTEEHVLRVLGSISDDQICTLTNHIISFDDSSPQSLISYIATLKLETFAPEIVWQRFMLVLKMIVWQKYGAPVSDISMTEELKTTLAKVPLKVMISLFHFCCQQEQLFLKAVDKHLFLSMFWVRIWAIAHSQASVGDMKAAPVKTEPPVPQKKTVDRVVSQPVASVAVSRTEHPNEWAAFLESVAKIDDQLVVSLFAQAKLKEHDKASGLLEVVFLKKFELFQDIFSRTESEWFAILKSVFGSNVKLEPIFEEGSKVQPQAAVGSKPVVKQATPEAPIKKVFYQSNNKVSVTNKDVPLDVSDKATWAMTHSLLEHFPGTVTEFKEDGDE